MTAGFSTKVTKTGPLFDGRLHRDIDAALQDTLQDVVERGESIVKRQLFPGHGFLFGVLRRSVAGEVKSRRAAVVETNVIYGPWIEGTSSRNQTTRFKGYGMFRKARKALDRGWPRILEKHLRRRLNRGL